MARKVGKPRGLIRYDSLNGLEGKARRFLRPRLWAYGTLLLGSAAALGVGLAGRTPFEANLLRMQGAPYLLEKGTVRNQFELHLPKTLPFAFTLEVRDPASGETKRLEGRFLGPQGP